MEIPFVTVASHDRKFNIFSVKLELKDTKHADVIL
jgi:hypothetical protein